MRRVLLLLVLILTGAGACKKEDDTVPYVPPYRVSGLTDFMLRKSSNSAPQQYQMYVALEHENEEQERVTLSLENVPTGLKNSIINPTGYPTFYTMIDFVDSGAAEGVHTIKLVTTGERSGRREFPFKVTIEAEPDCTPSVLGVYNTNSNCGSSAAYSTTVKASSVRNRVVFSNLNNTGLELYANVSCNPAVQMNIPTQMVNGVSYNGYGYFYINSQAQPTINLNVFQSNSGNCSYSLMR